MGCGLSKPAATNQPAPAPQRPIPTNANHSVQCTEFNNLTEKQTSYIDGNKLKQALDALFDPTSTLKLNYGMETRNDRWTFWAPKSVTWAELEQFADD